MQDLGLLRTDWDPKDAPYSNDQLARNFHRIAFFAFPNDQLHIPKPLTRWEVPVRYAVVGDRNDRAEVAELMARIARLTGLDIAPSSEREANFVVLTLDEHDRQATGQVLHNAAGRAFFETFLSAIHDCGAIASWTDTEPEITRAMVYLHGDLTDLYRTLCFHEEISQSFGLFNDDPTVRPSIFNDDEEFALLTRHDEYLLRILYDPRLKTGMTSRQAMPVVRTIIEELRPGR
ncbi:MAG TPA: DUF2927 domain-containing protein [Paracoccaceae bacterium]|nr:DUF2927 domain-containing protein [Paracoccaceae bacterium]